MRFLRQHSLIFFITILVLTGMACQAATNFQTTGTPINLPANNSANTDELIEAAVATAVAEENGNNAAPVINSQLAPADADLQSRLIEIYQRLNPSVVHIFVLDEQGQIFGSGSGFVLDNEGNIVTNNHVVASNTTIEVVFASGERRRAEIAGLDVDSDLAVITVNDLPADAPPIPLGDSSELNVGEFVITIGNPFGEAGSMSVGIVSGLGRTLSSQHILPGGGTFSIPQVIQTDAAINPGNSGGPLLNLQGEVVGVNSAIQTNTGTNSGVGFSIPVNAVRNIAPDLIANGRYVYSFMGISMTTNPFTLNELEFYNVPPNGVYIILVGDDTPAEKAGLIGAGSNTDRTPLPGSDYITAVNGVLVRTSDELLSYLVFETKPNETIELTIIRDGEEMTLPFTLGERP